MLRCDLFFVAAPQTPKREMEILYTERVRARARSQILNGIVLPTVFQYSASLCTPSYRDTTFATTDVAKVAFLSPISFAMTRRFKNRSRFVQTVCYLKVGFPTL